MSIQSGTAPSVIKWGDCTFEFVAPLLPERDASGAIKEVRPQARFAQANTVPLHKHGHGPFCRFRIAVPHGMAGLYALAVDEDACYIGACHDLGYLTNWGFGHISPADCFRGGQPTNCKLNHRVLEVSQAGERVDLYFSPKPKSERHELKLQLIDRCSPPWNGRTAP